MNDQIGLTSEAVLTGQGCCYTPDHQLGQSLATGVGQAVNV